MKTILITGGAGFIGSAFVRMAVPDPDVKVVNLDKLTYAGNLDSLEPVAYAPNYVFVEGDIADEALLSDVLKEHAPMAVVNFAAETHVDRSIDAPEAFVQTNVVGTRRLLESTLMYWRELPAAEKAGFRFLHVSTDEVYGSLGATGRFTEESPYQPNSPYAASKAASDHFVRAYHRTYGLPTLITNCSNNYGPYQFPEKLIPLMILKALRGEPLPVYGDGKHVRDWLFVEDHCHAIQLVLQRGSPGEVYNIGGNSEHSNLEVVTGICEIIDRLGLGPAGGSTASLIEFVADRPGHDRRYAIDMSKIRRTLGFSSTVPFQTGLEKTVRWYVENPDWVERVSSGAYRQQRLGLSPAGGG